VDLEGSKKRKDPATVSQTTSDGMVTVTTERTQINMTLKGDHCWRQDQGRPRTAKGGGRIPRVYRIKSGPKPADRIKPVWRSNI